MVLQAQQKVVAVSGYNLQLFLSLRTLLTAAAVFLTGTRLQLRSMQQPVADTMLEEPLTLN